MKDKNKKKPIGYICSECAISLGGEWPKNHIATCHIAMCSLCREEKSLSAPRNWRLGKYAQRINVSFMEWD